MALQRWQTGVCIDDNMIPCLGTVVLWLSLLVLAIYRLPALSPDQVTFPMKRIHGPSISLAAWKYGILDHAESSPIHSGVGRPA